MKILTVIGARPQFVKAAVFSKALHKTESFKEILVHTGQHYDNNMSDIFFEQMNIPAPDYHLGVGNCGHGAMTGRQLEKIEALLVSEKPDVVNVYGDTNSTLAGALAAAKLNIPIMHIEAGLRSYNRKMPEEVNRVLTDHISAFLFAPTDTAKVNLLKEGVTEDKIFVVGDIMYDAALHYSSMAVPPYWFADLPAKNMDDFYLCTIHRQENLNDKENIQNIFEAFAESGIYFILPLHPHTQKIIAQNDITVPANVHIKNPVGYLEMLWLLKNCSKVVTDSGGLQKEAFFHHKPCITMRNETEWVELLASGWNVLVGNKKEAILEQLESKNPPPFIDLENSPYGTGASADKMVSILSNALLPVHS